MRWHEHADQFVGFVRGGNLVGCSAGDEDDRPNTLRREFHQCDFLERRLARRRCRDDAFEDLFRTPVHVAHHRHAAEHDLTGRNNRAAKQVCGQSADHGQADKAKDQAEAGHCERQIPIRIINRRDIGFHPGIDDVDHIPGNVQRDGDGADDDEAGNEIISQPRADPGPRRSIALSKFCQTRRKRGAAPAERRRTGFWLGAARLRIQ